MHSFGAKEWADKCEQLDATIATLQAQLAAMTESRDAWRLAQECSEKAYMSLATQIPSERYDYDPVNLALLDGAKEQERIGRKQIADLQAQLRQVEGAYQKLLNVIDDSHDEDLPIEIIEARDEAYKFLVAQDAKPRKCPTCDSPSPHLHPAVQHEGEVQVCSNRWHKVAQDAGKVSTSIIGKQLPPSQWDKNAGVRGDIS